MKRFIASMLAGSAIAAHAQAQVQTVFQIAIENTNWRQAAGQSIQQSCGNAAAPWMNALVNGTLSTTVNGQTISSQTAYASAMHNMLSTPSGNNPGIHPSEPSYIWMEGGTHYGVLNDNDPCQASGGTHQATTQHLTRYLMNAGKPVRSCQ